MSAGNELDPVTPVGPLYHRAAPETILLPRPVWDRFMAPSRMGADSGLRTIELGALPGDRMHVAAWMALLGWTETMLAGALRWREEPYRAHPYDGLDRVEEYAKDCLQLGRYVVFGEQPDPTSPHAMDAFRSDKVPSNGVPWRLPREHLAEYLAEVLHRFDIVHPTGRTRRTDRHVLQLAMEVALAAGTVTPVLAVRRLAKAAGGTIDKDTISKSLRRLIGYGFLRRLGDRPVAGGQQYVILSPGCSDPYTSSSSFSVSRTNKNCPEDGTLPREHPAFHQRARGRTGFDLLVVLLTACPTTDREWWEAAGVSPRTFYAHKKFLIGTKLHLPALAFNNGDGWQLVEHNELMAALDEHARHSGTDSICRRKRWQMEQEQWAYRAHLLDDIADEYVPHDLQTARKVSTGELVRYVDLVGPGADPFADEGDEGVDAA